MASLYLLLLLLVAALLSIARAISSVRLAGTGLLPRSIVSTPPFPAIKRFLLPICRLKFAVSALKGADFSPYGATNRSSRRSPNAHRYVIVMAQMNPQKGG